MTHRTILHGRSRVSRRYRVSQERDARGRCHSSTRRFRDGPRIDLPRKGRSRPSPRPRRDARSRLSYLVDDGRAKCDLKSVGPIPRALASPPTSTRIVFRDVTRVSRNAPKTTDGGQHESGRNRGMEAAEARETTGGDARDAPWNIPEGREARGRGCVSISPPVARLGKMQSF